MFAFVISVVVVGTAVVIATRIASEHTAERDQPATPPGPNDRGEPAEVTAAQAPAPPAIDWTHDPLAPTALRRIRSALLLVVIVTVLGALTALLLVIGGAILLTGVRNAVQ